MRRALVLFGLAAVAACSPPAADGPDAEPDRAPPAAGAFAPLTGTLDRAAGVQQTLDEQAAARRRQIEEAER